MPNSLTILMLAVGSVVLVVLDPLWMRLGASYWRFTPMLARLRLSPRLRDKEHLEQLLKRLEALWGCPIEWRRSEHGIEFHGKGKVWQWLGCARIVGVDGRGWMSVEVPFRHIYLIPISVANVLLAGPLGWPVAAGLLLSVFAAFLVQRMFAQRLELVARITVMKPERQRALFEIAQLRLRRRN